MPVFIKEEGTNFVGYYSPKKGDYRTTHGAAKHSYYCSTYADAGYWVLTKGTKNISKHRTKSICVRNLKKELRKFGSMKRVSGGFKYGKK